MKKIFVFTGIFLMLFFSKSFSLDTKLIDYGFERSILKDISINNDYIAFLFKDTDYPGPFFLPDVVILNENGWERAPNYIGSDTSNKILAADYSQIHFDSLGNIWICGLGLYKYDGSQWTSYIVKGDPDVQSRRFEQFCVDKFNNIWITSIVRFSSTEGYSEFFKFDGEKFISMEKYSSRQRFEGVGDMMSPFIISAAPDGKVILSETIDSEDEDYNDGNFKDIFIFNQDLSFGNIKIPSTSGSDYERAMKSVSCIYAEADGKIWFPLGRLGWGGIIEGSETGACCSGLVMYDNGQWTIFNESNGLDTLHENLYEPIYRILKLSGDNYLLIGRNLYYIMDSHYNIKKYMWEDLFNKAEFIVCHSYFNGEEGYNYLSNYLPYPPESVQIGIDKVILKDNKIYMGMQKGLLVFNESDLFTSSVIEETHFDVMVYPNPARDYITIKSDISFNSYRITNSLGQQIKSGVYANSHIPVNDLPAGYYYIKLEGLNNSSVFTFIKE